MNLSYQTLWWSPCIYLNPSKLDAFSSMTLLVLIPTGSASTAMNQFNGNLKTYLHLLPSAHFSIYFTLQTHLSCKTSNISIHTLLHKVIPYTLLTLFSVKTSDASVVSWLQDITSVLLTVIIHNNLFHHATIWIQHTHLPTSLKYFCLDIIYHYFPTSCKFHMQLSHATNFG